jgi:hypothetical protein
MSTGLDVGAGVAAVDRPTGGVNSAVEPHEQIYREAMERIASITAEWSETVGRLTREA